VASWIAKCGIEKPVQSCRHYCPANVSVDGAEYDLQAWRRSLISAQEFENALSSGVEMETIQNEMAFPHLYYADRIGNSMKVDRRQPPKAEGI